MYMNIYIYISIYLSISIQTEREGRSEGGMGGRGRESEIDLCIYWRVGRTVSSAPASFGAHHFETEPIASQVWNYPNHPVIDSLLFLVVSPTLLLSCGVREPGEHCRRTVPRMVGCWVRVLLAG